jgi:ferric-dicitrate binding protein FerR (iron transport regulator)
MSEQNDVPLEDAEIAELLRQAGARVEPPEDMMREVQAAVHAQWRQVVAARQHRRRTFAWAAAAAVGALAVGATFTLQRSDIGQQRIATLQRADGDIFVAADGTHWNRLHDGQPIAVGDFIRSEARAALRFDSGVALRVDRGSMLQVKAANRLALNVGAVYVDSPPDSTASALVIDTHAGAVRHIGTQYLVRTRPDGIDVSVREGRVLIEHATNSSTAAAGEKLALSNQGVVQRSAIAATDAQWRWASEIAPPFVIENQTLSAFLAWVARETGRTLVYESTLAERTAAGVILHGSIEGLAPDVALATVLMSTSLQRKTADAAIIEIGLATAIDPVPPARATR